MWRGSGANDREVISAEESIDVIAEAGKVIRVKEDAEPNEFW